MAVAVAVGVCGEIRGVAGRELWLHLALQKFDTSHLGYLAIQIQWSKILCCSPQFSNSSRAQIHCGKYTYLSELFLSCKKTTKLMQNTDKNAQKLSNWLFYDGKSYANYHKKILVVRWILLATGFVLSA